MKFKTKIIFLVGPPLSGKDTQGRLLAKKLKGKFIVTSELIRNFFRKTKKNYIKIKDKFLDLRKEREKLKIGALVDSFLVSHLILKRLEEAIEKKETLIISGSPRRIPEAKKEFYFLRNNASFAFIFLNVSQKEIFKRALKRKRDDDAINVLKKRIELYKKETLPTIDFLRKNRVLIRIKGEKPVLNVHQEIMKKLKTFSML